VTVQPAFLDPPDSREGGADAVHVLMPNMAYACGGNILTKRGTSRCGPWSWDEITCPDCRALGREPLLREVARQQGHEYQPEGDQA
jgi:hypothetical protein